MAVTKLDISLAARAAGHLYLTTGIVAAGIFGALAAMITYPFRRQVGHLFETDTVSLTFLSIGFLSALYYARRELNGWAYVIATPWPVLFVAALGASYFDSLSTLKKIEIDIDDVIVNFVPKLGLALFITIYLVRVLIDYSRLALSGHNASSIPPLRLANEVSKLLRHRRSLLPWIHKPTNQGRTFVYAILFLSFVGLVIYLHYLATVYKNVSSEIWVFENFGGALLLIAYVGAAAMAGLARRHYVLGAARVLELDNRRPILFLRSFADDKVRLWGKGIYGKFRRRTIDEAIDRLARRLGPFVAIANPNTQLPRLGAAQTYFSNDTWQNAIARWVQTAQMIVMVAGRTEGIRWELAHILADEGQAKLVIFLPPALRKDSVVASRWFSEHFSHTRYGQDSSAIDPRKVIGIAFREDGLFVVETRRVHRREVDYLVAMQAIIFATAAKASAQQPAQAPKTFGAAA
jgi:hypothetical protein